MVISVENRYEFKPLTQLFVFYIEVYSKKSYKFNNSHSRDGQMIEKPGFLPLVSPTVSKKGHSEYKSVKPHLKSSLFHK